MEGFLLAAKEAGRKLCNELPKCSQTRVIVVIYPNSEINVRSLQDDLGRGCFAGATVRPQEEPSREEVAWTFDCEDVRSGKQQPPPVNPR
jgi:hypothetical protein